MFKWLRDKLMKGSEEEFAKGLDRNTNFLEFAKSFNNNSDEVNDLIYALETENMRLWTFGYNEQTMSKLLDLDMNCRRMFANVYGGSDLKYNKKFDPKPGDSKPIDIVKNNFEDLAEDIHSKFHKTCNILKKINKKTSTTQLVALLNRNKIELDASFAQQNKIGLDRKNQVILEIGNNQCMPVIEAEDYHKPDFKKYIFRIVGTGDLNGISLEFNCKIKKKIIQLIDFNKAFNLSKTITKPIGPNAEELYDLIVEKGKFNEEKKEI